MDIDLDMTLEEKVLAAIDQGKLDDCLEVVIDYAMQRRQLVSLDEMHRLKAGDKVRVVNRPTIKPAYMRGVICTVTKKNKTTIDVTIDDADPNGDPQYKGKYTGQLRLPVAMMEPMG